MVLMEGNLPVNLRNRNEVYVRVPIVVVWHFGILWIISYRIVDIPHKMPVIWYMMYMDIILQLLPYFVELYMTGNITHFTWLWGNIWIYWYHIWNWTDWYGNLPQSKNFPIHVMRVIHIGICDTFGVMRLIHNGIRSDMCVIYIFE